MLISLMVIGLQLNNTLYREKCSRILFTYNVDSLFFKLRKTLLKIKDVFETKMLLTLNNHMNRQASSSGSR